MTRSPQRGQAGLTLIEVMIASAILALMLTLAWSTTARTGEAKRSFEALEERSQEIRIALGRVVADLEQAYLSRNEDTSALERRTLFVGKDGGSVDEVRFSSFGHQVLWSEANESDQTMITYSAATDRKDGSKTNWLRREQRRLSDVGESSKEMPAELDILLHDIEQVDFQYWDWKDSEWKGDWDSTKQDGQRDRLPTRVRITVTYLEGDAPIKVTTQARLLLQEPIEARFGTQYDRGQ